MIENKLSQLPVINVPSITFDGEDDGVRPPSPELIDSLKFKGFRQHRILAKVGHNVPQEAPKNFAKAVLKLCLIN